MNKVFYLRNDDTTDRYLVLEPDANTYHMPAGTQMRIEGEGIRDGELEIVLGPGYFGVWLFADDTRRYLELIVSARKSSEDPWVAVST